MRLKTEFSYLGRPYPSEVALLSDEVYRLTDRIFASRTAPPQPGDLVRLVSYGEDFPMPGTSGNVGHFFIVWDGHADTGPVWYCNAEQLERVDADQDHPW